MLETQDGQTIEEDELVKCGLSPAILQRQEMGEDRPESSKRRNDNYCQGRKAGTKENTYKYACISRCLLTKYVCNVDM